MSAKKTTKSLKREKPVKKRRIHVTSGSGLAVAIGIVVVLFLIILTKLSLI